MTNYNIKPHMSNQVYSNDIHQYPIDVTSNPSIVTLTGVQILTNKQLNSPTINNATLNNPAIAGIPTGTTPTYTNLGIDSGTGLLAAISNAQTPLNTPTITRWTLTTVGAVTQSFAVPVTAGHAITAVSRVSGTVTVGALLNNTLSRQTSSLVNSTSGSAVWVSDYNQLSGNEVAGTNAAVLQHLAAVLNVTAAVTGVAGNTIVWEGYTEIIQ